MDRVLLRIQEVAVALGLSRSSTYSLVKSGQIASRRVGKSLRVRPEDVRAFVDGLLADTDDGGEIRRVPR